MKSDKPNYLARKSCLVCGNEKLLCDFHIKDFDTGLGSFKLLRCPVCGMMYTSPYPEEASLHLLYQNRGSGNFDEGNNVFFEFLKDFMAKQNLKQYLKRFNTTVNSFVDVGTGNARFPCVFMDLCPSAQITAVDFPFSPPLRIGRGGHKKIEYIQTQVFLQENEKYDLIFLRHVLEHVHNPVDFVNNLNGKLNEGGMMVIEVPDISHPISKLFKKYSPSFYPPYHLTHFSTDNIKCFMDKAAVNYDIAGAEMPLMSNLLANLFGCKLNNIFRLFGVFLHPIQLFLSFISGKKTVVVAVIRK